MGVSATLSYRHIRNTALPYVTASAPTSTNPQYVDGLNVLTSYKGYLERRPGFAPFETIPTVFAGTIQRVFGWRRWGGTFFLMLNEVTPTASNVYKLAIGVDVSFVQIFSSTTTNIFDFVVSNNFCFFGNGVDMKKFDGTNITNWGIAIGSINTNSTGYAGTGTSTPGSYAHPWANPTRVQGAPDGNTSVCSFIVPAHSASGSDFLNGTNYTFSPSIATTSQIVGIQVAVTGFFSGRARIGVSLQVGGVTIGQGKIVPLGLLSSTVTVGSNSDLWGATITANTINDSSFGVQIFFTDINTTSSPQTSQVAIDSAQIIIYYLGGPTIAVSGSAGTFSATNGGYQYVYSYYNANTGHTSSPTLPSIASGNFTNKLNIGITLTASTDPQVTGIRLFRTTDGGGGVYFEVQGSPYPNVNGVVTDNTTDANLSVITAPTFGFNDPPPPQQGFVWFANRIWGFIRNTVYFTDWEELNIGVAEESSVSGPSGNFWNFDSEVTALSVAQDGVIIKTAGGIFKIDGDSLDTFRRTNIAKGIGCRNRATIARLGAMTAFLANTNSIWTTDSNSLQEISQMIQPTFDGIDHSQASSTFHIQGQNRWLLVCDAGHSRTLCYDTNTQQWMPPWSIVGTACGSFETSTGNWDLFIAQQGTNILLQLTPNAYLDNGVPYAASLTTNPMPIVNEHLGAGSAYIDLYYPQNPGQVSYVEYLGCDFNAILPADVLYEFDDDPATAAYTSIIVNAEDAPLKTQGINVKNMWYYLRQGTARRVSWKLVWWAQNSNFKLYTISLAYRIYR